MIVVKVELHSANTHKVTTIGTARIWNTGSGTRTRGNYMAEIRGKDGRVLETVSVGGFPRLRLLAWDLVYRVLRCARGDKNDDAVTKAQRDYLARMPGPNGEQLT